MRTILFTILICSWLFMAAAGDSPAPAAIDVRTEDLAVSPPTANWISYNGDYSGRRYSGLSEINTSNVDHLRPEWVFHRSEEHTSELQSLV